jgi:ATP-binding cassette subfamily B protein
VVQALLALVPLVVLRLIVDRLRSSHPDLGPLIPLVLISIAGLAASAIFGVGSTYLQELATEGIVCDLRDQLFANLVAQPTGFWVSRRGGDLTSRIINDISAIDTLLASASLTLLNSTLQVAGVIVLTLVLSWQLALVMLVVIPLGILPLRRAGFRMGAARLRVQQQMAVVTAYVQEVLSVSGARLVRAHGRASEERSRFAVMNRELRRREVTAAMSARWFTASLSMLGIGGPVVLLLVGGYLIVHEHLSLGTVLVVALLLSNRLGNSLQSLAGALAELLASVPIWKRIFATLDERPSLIESPNAKVVAPSATRGAIELEDVSFLYPGQATPATVGVSVLIEAGQRVAIVGPTGAGKSTLVALIARFADPASGRVLLDGQDLRDLTLESLARAIGVVFQDNFLFNAPLSENLRYAAPDASDDELWGALRSAKLDVVVRGLPEQLETIVGERGFRLSGGEQQRVAIARAILKHPPVLILDEATSNLDRIVEQEVQQALERLFAGRTTVVIAHRLVTIRDADMILVMDAGRIAERGSHAELIMQDGLYARLYEAQASSFV